MTPLREMTLRWNAFVGAIVDEDIGLATKLSKADPEFLLKPPKHLQKSKSTTAEIYNREPFPIAFAWLWDQVSDRYPDCDNQVVKNLLARSATLDTHANLEHLVRHYEAKGLDPLGALHEGLAGEGKLLHIALKEGKISTADWMLTRRPELLEMRDLAGQTPAEFLDSRIKLAASQSSIAMGDSPDDLVTSKNFIEVWSRRRIALGALTEMESASKRFVP